MLIKPNRVTIHFECCECRAKSTTLLSDLVNMTFLCNRCNNMENYMEIIGVSIKEPKIKKDIKLKEVCFKCHTFDKSLGKGRSYKCTLSYSCPGLNWSEEKKQRAIRRNGRWS